MGALRVEQHGGVTLVTIDSPPVNAIKLADYVEIGDLFEMLGKDMKTHCAVLTGAGDRIFCAGKDLKEFLAARVEDDAEQAKVVRRCYSAILHCEIPVIAAVNGTALGAGTVLASVCDIRLASSTARFGLPEINVGRCGGGSHVGRHIPQGAMRRMFFTGRPIDAQEAWRLGFVQEVVEAEALLPSAMDLALEIAAKAPLGLRIGKASLNEAEALPIEEGYMREQAASTRLMATRDAREATRAVVEKRAPVFIGE